jgi:hypothetical protein
MSLLPFSEIPMTQRHWFSDLVGNTERNSTITRLLNAD